MYEASLHHVLFVNNSENPRVIELIEFPTKKQISIPAASMDALRKHLEHDGKAIIPTYEGVGKTDQSKVRFDRNAECAGTLGIVEPWLRDELIEFYEARNSIHILRVEHGATSAAISPLKRMAACGAFLPSIDVAADDRSPPAPAP